MIGGWASNITTHTNSFLSGGIEAATPVFLQNNYNNLAITNYQQLEANDRETMFTSRHKKKKQQTRYDFKNIVLNKPM